eukprot:5786841-Pyramimonas_sp.AAC.1
MSLPGPEEGMGAVVLRSGAASDAHPVMEWSRSQSHDLVHRYSQYAALSSGRGLPARSTSPSSSPELAPLLQITPEARATRVSAGFCAGY